MTTGASSNVTVARTLGGPNSAKSLLTSLLMSSEIRCGSTPLPLSAREQVSDSFGSGFPSLESGSEITFFLLFLLPLLFLLLLITYG